MCQVWCNGIQDIYAQLAEGPSAFGIYVHCAISAKFGVAVFQASMLDRLVGGPLGKVGLSAKWCNSLPEIHA